MTDLKNFYEPTCEHDESGYIWEKSGLYQGDIMKYPRDQRNGLTDNAYRWPNATIPFYIEDSHFSPTEITAILSAIREFESKTCVRFRPYRKSDENWVFITGNENGCWSFIGNQQKGGQQLNLQSPGCGRKGTVMHEMLHACGFLHEQSTYNRDNYVKILTENIEDEHLFNFLRYNDSVVTDYNTTYDYDSIMHYSAYAFSKNGKPTIKATRENRTTLGQRNGFSQTDLIKLNQMYRKTCNPPAGKRDHNGMLNTMDWFRQMFPQ